MEDRHTRRHLVWDWNGTLFNDASAILAATNDIFATHGVHLTAEQYRTTFTRPLATFYATALNKSVDEHEFSQLDAAFHTAYRVRMLDCALAPDATSAITAWHSAGHTQSLLSLWVHEELRELVTKLGLTAHFLAIDGRKGSNIGGKTQPLTVHLQNLGVAPSHVTLIGDSLDDAVAARTVGAKCLLLDAGTHERAALHETGFPVVSTLTDAVELALR